MRVIAGKYKGTQLLSFETDNIRPTIDRVKEGIFSKIQFNIQNATVLDLFGGTGGVSLEFLSRNAQKVVTVDNNANSTKLIKKNFQKCNANLNLMECDYKKALKQCVGNKFDFIYLDPPFDTNYGEDSLFLIAKYELLAESGLVIYEHLSTKQFDLPSNLKLIDSKKYGTIVISFIARAR